MTLADKITSVRLVLAPLFFVVYLLPVFFPRLSADLVRLTVPVLWGLFIVSEISDMFDGMVARRRKEVSDFGKLFDPFADTLVQITYFLCFVMDGIFPVILLLLVLYREFGILFLRNLMLKKGVAMGARLGGKIKTVTYIIAGAAALLAVSFRRFGIGGAPYTFLRMPPWPSFPSRRFSPFFPLSIIFRCIAGRNRIWRPIPYRRRPGIP
jgi:CDP-diacylglycerol--glycerol-3-phosphate 3-phosphatidyltransferase